MGDGLGGIGRDVSAPPDAETTACSGSFLSLAAVREEDLAGFGVIALVPAETEVFPDPTFRLGTETLAAGCFAVLRALVGEDRAGAGLLPPGTELGEGSAEAGMEAKVSAFTGAFSWPRVRFSVSVPWDILITPPWEIFWAFWGMLVIGWVGQAS